MPRLLPDTPPRKTLGKVHGGGMRRSSLAEQDAQVADLEDAAAAAQALAEQLRHAPVPVVELALELGEDPQQLAHRLNGDTYADDLGRKVVTRALARTLIEQRNADEAQRQAIRERNEANVRAAGEQNDAENKAALDYIDARQRRYGDPVTAHRLDVLAVLGAAVHDEAMATADEHEQAWLDEMAERDRTAKRFDAHGNLIN
jgi:hypothetical protein